MKWENIDAVLFDLDGVLTPTAEVHMRAWAHLFTDYLAARTASGRADLAPYTDQDYFDYIDGKPRYEGVASMLESRGIELPYGDPSDSPEAETVCGLGNRKDAAFNEVLAVEGIHPYPKSVALLDFLDANGIAKAVVSSSKNAPLVLRTAGLDHRFAVVIEGKVAAAKGIPGKPKPDTYQFAADELGVPHNRSVVVEDAISGVRAGAAGDFAAVVGVDRGAGAAALSEAGATVVVRELDELI